MGLMAATAAVGGFVLLPRVSHGNDYVVTHTGDAGAGSLRDAIEQANLAGAGNHTISFDSGLPANSLLQLASQLEHINVNIVIDGGGHTLSGHQNHQIFFVGLGNVTIKNFTLAEGNSVGGTGGSTNLGGGGGGGLGAGGAIFVNSGANVTIENVVFAQNAAQGGAGGSVNGVGSSAGGGAGGGFHGDGGNGGYDGGGGGGGFLGNGGNADTAINARAGGGGGGLLLNGGDSTGVVPGLGALTGGNGGTNGNSGGDGIATGGGGGGGGTGAGGTGGDFGGGGGGGYNGTGGNGGFGGGSGGTGFLGSAGTSGFGGGQGGATYIGGGGGSGYGGAIFVRSGGSLTVIDSTFNNNTVAVGAGGSGNVQNGADGNAAGSGVYVMSGTTLNFSVTNNGSITVADTIGGDGAVTKLGAGELNLTGTNTYTGATTVDAGRLRINGSVTSDVTVNNSGTLGGSGDINGNLTSNGIVAPGNSIGQLNVVGLYQQNPGSQLEIEINDAGQNDVVNVQGDVILNGGTVNVKAAPGNYVHGQTYTFLTYSGSLFGVGYDGITDDLAFFDAVLQYNPGDISFYLASNANNFGDIARTFNQHSVANVFDANPGSALQPLADEMLFMTNDQVCYSLDQLSGEVYGTSSQMQFQNTTNQLQMLAQHLRPTLGVGGLSGGIAAAQPVPASETLIAFDPAGELVIRGQSSYAPRYRTWGTGYGLGGNAQSDGNAAGLGYALGGVQLGVDRWLDEGTLAGLYGGYNYAQLDGRGLTQRVQANSGQFGGYFRRDDGCDYYLVASGLSFDAYDASRTIGIGGFNAVASANYDGWQSATYLERGRTYQVGLTTWQPYVAAQYIYLRQNSFNETGGGIANLDVAGVDAHSLRSVLGVRASRELVTSRGLVIVPQARAAWLHEFLDTNTLVTNGFGAVGGSSFDVRGLDLGRDWALVGAGLGWQLTSQLTLTGNYDAQVNDRQTFHIGSANVQYIW